MKRGSISHNVIRRLPRYIRKLDDLLAHDVTRISSGELGKQMGLTPSQIRQDFSCFGEFGQQGYGYNVQMLRDAIADILGANRGYSVVVVGVGNLGHALIKNFDFTHSGCRVIGAFDVLPELIGSEVGGVRVQPGSMVHDFVRENEVDIAVLTVSRLAANSVARQLAENGIKAIWNFTNVELELQDTDVVVENVHFSDSLLALSYYLSEKVDGEASGGKS